MSPTVTGPVRELPTTTPAAAGPCLLFVPETVGSRRRPALRFVGLGIPDRGRAEFIAAATAAFSLLGLFSALACSPRSASSPWSASEGPSWRAGR